MKHIAKMMNLFMLGGLLYGFVEILWRNHTHYTMILVGGICFVLIGLLNEGFTWDMSLLKQSIIASCLVTIIEFISGCVINLWLGLGVWDYSSLPFNLLGQVSLLYSFLWIPLGAVAIIVDDYLRYWLYDEEKPHYKLF